MFTYFDIYNKWVEYDDFVEITMGECAIYDPELMEIPRDPDEKLWRNKEGLTDKDMEGK